MKGKIEVDTDMANTELKAIIESIIFPDLKNAELQNAYNAVTEEDLLYKMLEGRELKRLGSKILRNQGFTEDFEDMVELAKN